MQTQTRPRSSFISLLPWLLLLAILGLLTLRQRLAGWSVWSIYLQGFTMLFISILLESLPFVLLGCLVSSVIRLYLSDEVLARLLPRNYYLGLLTASLIGVVFPLGGYAVVPVAQGLLKKGVSVGAATTFLLAAPVVNPIVLSATHHAFGGSVGVVLLRAVCGWLMAIFVGDLVGRLYQQAKPIRHVGFYEQQEDRTLFGRGRTYGPQGTHQSLMEVLQQTSDQIFEIGRWLILGTMLVAALRTFVPSHLLSSTGKLTFLTIPVFMLLAYVLSVCSEADSFLARVFVGQFAGSSILAFLLLGPMLNLQNTAKLLGNFERSFVRQLFGLGTVCVLVMAALANVFGF